MLTDNINFLSPTGYKLIIQKVPNVEYFCTAVSMPSIMIGETPFNTSTRNISVFADKLNFESLNVRLAVDENMENYKEVFDWINDVVYTEASPEHLSDMTLLVMSSHNNVTNKIVFKDAYPTSIGNLDFDSRAESVEYITTEVSFKFTEMKFI